MRKRGRENETPVTVTDVQATYAYYPEAAATACSCQAFQLLAEQVDTPTLSSLRVMPVIPTTFTTCVFIVLSVSRSINRLVYRQIA